MKRFQRLLIWVICVVFALGMKAQWQADVLGEGFEQRTVEQAEDYDGKVWSTIIRHRGSECVSRGALYVHGYNDYFFQREMAEEFVEHGYEFYAVDLRKYGRSLREGQQRYQVRNISEYFADIDSALRQMRQDGIREVVLIGHSTGGLITSYYMAKEHPAIVKALVLNSPFLAWNFTGFMKHIGIPGAAAVGKLFPNIEVSSGGDGRYGKSLLKEYWGEWDFDRELKLVTGSAVTTGWVRAIDKSQKWLIDHPYSIHVPVILMHSDRAIGSEDTDADYLKGDAVLNPGDISAAGRKLSRRLTDLTVIGGLHDLVLSPKPVREALYAYLFRYLDGIPALKCR